MDFIKKYIWYVLEIKYSEKCSFDNAFDMFIFNVETGTERYHSISDIDYKKINKEWECMMWYAKEKQRSIFRSIVLSDLFMHLLRAYESNNRILFNAVCKCKI